MLDNLGREFAIAWFGVTSYGIAALIYGAVTMVLLVSQPGSSRARWLIWATAISALWAAGIVLLLLARQASLPGLVGLDALHSFVWLVCIVSRLAPPAAGAGHSIGRWLLAVSAASGGWALFASLAFPSGAGADSVYLGLLVMSLIGFLAVEQLYRNAEEQGRGLGLLCLGVGGVFVVDLFTYSQAMLLSGLVPVFWESRGLANAVLAPLIVLAIKRQPEWERELFVSRHVAFYTASLLGVGGYLLTMGVVAFVIRAVGGQWGFMLGLLFLGAALALLVAVLFLSGIRARLKVFLVKHFYRNKYDYRHEWLRLTEILGQTREPKLLAASALRGIARIIGSERAGLWITRDGRRYEWMLSLDEDARGEPPYDHDHPVVAFLDSRRWVIDSQEYAREPAHYDSAFGPPADAPLPPDSIIVPLDCQGRLLGFVMLSKPPQTGALNFEDHDILKTAGRQVAVFLAQALAQEQLAETRQFEAMNKLSTFLMHDLKNVIAQQELVVSNAQRFRHRPEFIDDAIGTIRSSVERMRKVLEQLRGAVREEPTGARVDVSKVLIEVRSHCADREPVPHVAHSNTPVWARMDKDKLVAVLTHLVRNAQDATAADGSITVALAEGDDELEIVVRDTGCGMDSAFLRDRLFRPFDTTKGARGMGIGAYQVRDTVRAAGGDVHVSSEPGVGTTFRLRIPCAAEIAAADWRRDEPAA